MLSEYVKDIVYSTPSNKELVNVFFSNKPDTKRFVIGKNEESQYLIQTYQIDGLIDDFAADGLYWNSVPIVKMNAVPADALIINCSSSISPVSIYRKLEKAGYKRVLGYHDLLSGGTGVPIPKFVDETRNDFSLQTAEWQFVYDRMHDEESKKTFLNLLAFRLTGNAAYMQSYNVRIIDQYLESFMDYSQEVFADVGGFNGDTTEEFAIRYPDYKQIHFFEPSAINMTAAKERLKNFQNIVYYNYGVSSQDETLYFNENAGSASSIKEAGEVAIQVSTLDKMVDKPLTFIKMDVEGWELKALHGSAAHIQKNRPKLAIAVYHNAKDFWQLPKYILSLHPDYTLYLRHYTEGWSETIMYFKPA